MNPETKTCQNCKNQFVIELADFAFYEKIKVPPPTWCPECRMVRRLLWRNERVWYGRKCDATGADILTFLPPDKPYKVYEHNYWRSDAWDPFSYGRDYDFSKNFFVQFKELFEAIPHPNLIQKNNINSDYSNYTLNLKNCYFAASNDTAEDCAYTFGYVLNARDCLDIYQSTNIEACYELTDCSKSNKLHFSQNCEACVDSFLLYDCRNCLNCVGCVGLRNRQYHIFNRPYSKENYFTKVKELNLNSFFGLQKAKTILEDLKLKVPRKYANVIKSENVVGEDIAYTRNCYFCFSVRNDVENGKYLLRVGDRTKDGHDAFVAWKGAELFYDVVSVSGRNVQFSNLIWGGFDIQYSYNCFDCNNIFGCVGLRNKSYCILNKQYGKEDYEKLLPKIIAHINEMLYVDGQGRKYPFGEFFPPELSPFRYNETMAQDYYPTTPDKARVRGFGWKEKEERHYQITKQSEDLPDSIEEVDDSILQDTIGCAHEGKCLENCATAFRIIHPELRFYKTQHLPLPRLCPSCRHHQRLKQRNPLKLWKRQCQCAGEKSENGIYANTSNHPSHSTNQPCSNEFQTSYSPERSEIVYCEECYQQEVV